MFSQLPDEDNGNFISQVLYNRIIKSWISNSVTTPYLDLDLIIIWLLTNVLSMQV